MRTYGLWLRRHAICASSLLTRRPLPHHASTELWTHHQQTSKNISQAHTLSRSSCARLRRRQNYARLLCSCTRMAGPHHVHVWQDRIRHGPWAHAQHAGSARACIMAGSGFIGMVSICLPPRMDIPWQTPKTCRSSSAVALKSKAAVRAGRMQARACRPLV